ncbi:hypothetical protein [Flexistipes sp.]|uniref:hypothetical protein n=1 Tax=Flexistipes sp. TaxID=3088135 RepID=UPI002E2190C4|nr:hypothetical protein [Flexistipes sp.]
MKQLIFILALAFGYHWMVQNGYTEEVLKAIGDFDPDGFVQFVKSLTSELADLAAEIFKQVRSQ